MDIEREIPKIKEKLTNMCLAFNSLTKESNSDKRNSKDSKRFREQRDFDRIQLNAIRNNALALFDDCNKILLAN